MVKKTTLFLYMARKTTLLGVSSHGQENNFFKVSSDGQEDDHLRCFFTWSWSEATSLKGFGGRSHPRFR